MTSRSLSLGGWDHGYDAGSQTNQPGCERLSSGVGRLGLGLPWELAGGGGDLRAGEGSGRCAREGLINRSDLSGQENRRAGVGVGGGAVRSPALSPG